MKVLFGRSMNVLHIQRFAQEKAFCFGYAFPADNSANLVLVLKRNREHQLMLLKIMYESYHTYMYVQ